MDLQKLGELHIGPILFREETKFLREVGLNDRIKVDIQLAAMRRDASRWTIVHNIFRSDGIHSAIITVDGAWLDLLKRKLVVPPKEVLEVVDQMPKHPDFVYLENK